METKKEAGEVESGRELRLPWGSSPVAHAAAAPRNLALCTHTTSRAWVLTAVLKERCLWTAPSESSSLYWGVSRKL